MKNADVKKELRALSDPEIASHSKRFFKTGPGEYSEGDQFLGIRVPEIRKQARKYKSLPLEETEKLLQSSYHEERLCALIILVNKFESGDAKKQEKKQIFDLYITSTKYNKHQIHK